MENNQYNAIAAQLADMEIAIRNHEAEVTDLRKQHQALKQRVDLLEQGSTTMHNENLERFDKIGDFIAKVDPVLTEVMQERSEKAAVRAWMTRCFSSGRRIAFTIIAVSAAIGVLSGSVAFIMAHIR